MADLPDDDQLSRYFSKMGRKGGKERARRLTAEQRKEIATKASKAAAKVRTRKAREKGKTARS
jgi:hypothetical protein